MESFNIVGINKDLKMNVIEISTSPLEDKLFASISFSSHTKLRKEFSNKDLTKRETNRHHFSTEFKDYGLIESVNDFARSLGVTISYSNTLSQETKKYIKNCENYVWEDYKAFMDTSKWIRFSEKEKLETKDGFGLKNIMLNRIDGFFVKLFRKSEFLFKSIYKIGLKFKVSIDASKMIQNTGVFIRFGADGDNPESFVSVGRVALRVWLKLNNSGYAVQPLSLASLFALSCNNNTESIVCSKKYLSMFTKGHQSIDQEFAREDQTIWMLRSGRCNPLNNLERTLRKDIKTFIKD